MPKKIPYFRKRETVLWHWIVNIWSIWFIIKGFLNWILYVYLKWDFGSIAWNLNSFLIKNGMWRRLGGSWIFHGRGRCVGYSTIFFLDSLTHGLSNELFCGRDGWPERSQWFFFLSNSSNPSIDVKAFLI
jgi:hypothetical protein